MRGLRSCVTVRAICRGSSRRHPVRMSWVRIRLEKAMVTGEISGARFKKWLAQPPVGRVVSLDAAEARERNVIGGEQDAVRRGHVEKTATASNGLCTVHVGDGLPIRMCK